MNDTQREQLEAMAAGYGLVDAYMLGATFAAEWGEYGPSISWDYRPDADRMAEALHEGIIVGQAVYWLKKGRKGMAMRALRNELN